MDKVMAHWLEGQLEAGMALHAESDLLELRPVELGLFPAASVHRRSSCQGVGERT